MRKRVNPQSRSTDEHSIFGQIAYAQLQDSREEIHGEFAALSEPSELKKIYYPTLTLKPFLASCLANPSKK